LRPFGRVVIGTVEGDVHDIGKNLVITMLRANGFEVIDLGVDVPPKRFVEAVKQYKPDIVGMSALLTSTMVNMKRVIEALEEEGLRSSVKVIVGGAPITEKFAREIGADAYGENAVTAIEICKKLVEELHRGK
jgi:methylmalonyl-CoA mutase cobalamin-binding domain/chain